MTTRAEIHTRVLKVIAEHFAHTPGKECPEVTEASALMGAPPHGLGFDSLDGIEIVLAIEDEFLVDIDDDAAEGLLTVAHIVHFIAGQLAVAV